MATMNSNNEYFVLCQKGGWWWSWTSQGPVCTFGNLQLTLIASIPVHRFTINISLSDLTWQPTKPETRQHYYYKTAL